MSVWKQIFLGSLVLVLCVVVHVAVMGVGVYLLNLWEVLDVFAAGVQHWSLLILSACCIVLTGHTLQVWIWALTFRVLGALGRLDDAIYFALVTTTTLGYGDVTLERPFRVFGAMAAVSGLMTFGLSTAFLTGLTFYIIDPPTLS